MGLKGRRIDPVPGHRFLEQCDACFIGRMRLVEHLGRLALRVADSFEVPDKA